MNEIPRDIAWTIGCGSCYYLHCQLNLLGREVSYHCKDLKGAAIEVMNLGCYCLNHKYEPDQEGGTY